MPGAMLMKSEQDKKATAEIQYRNTAQLECSNPSARVLLVLLLLLSLNFAACYDSILSRLFGGLRRLRSLTFRAFRAFTRFGRRKSTGGPLARLIFAGFQARTADGTPRILIVEDDQVTAHAYAQSLLRAGYEVRVAATGPDALAQVALWQPDGILLDVLLPELDGIEVLRQIRRQQPDLPVVICTNILSPGLKNLAEIGGATRVFDKSLLTSRELVSELDRTVIQHHHCRAA
jgi:CheY-like chemotaxis protein